MFVCMTVFMLVRMLLFVNVRMPVMFMTVLVFTLSVMMSAGAFSFMLMFFHNKTSNLSAVYENKLWGGGISLYFSSGILRCHPIPRRDSVLDSKLN